MSRQIPAEPTEFKAEHDPVTTVKALWEVVQADNTSPDPQAIAKILEKYTPQTVEGEADHSLVWYLFEDYKKKPAKEKNLATLCACLAALQPHVAVNSADLLKAIEISFDDDVTVLQNYLQLFQSGTEALNAALESANKKCLVRIRQLLINQGAKPAVKSNTNEMQHVVIDVINEMGDDFIYLPDSVIEARIRQAFSEHPHLSNNAKDSEANTPLLRAIYFGNRVAVNTILALAKKHGKDVLFHSNTQGLSALSCAVNYSDDGVAHSNSVKRQIISDILSEFVQKVAERMVGMLPEYQINTSMLDAISIAVKVENKFFISQLEYIAINLHKIYENDIGLYASAIEQSILQGKLALFTHLVQMQKWPKAVHFYHLNLACKEQQYEMAKMLCNDATVAQTSQKDTFKFRKNPSDPFETVKLQKPLFYVLQYYKNKRISREDAKKWIRLFDPKNGLTLFTIDKRSYVELHMVMEGEKEAKEDSSELLKFMGEYFSLDLALIEGMLRDNGASLQDGLLCKAVSLELYNVASFLLEKKLPINDSTRNMVLRNYVYSPALQIAIHKGNLPLVKLLKERGAILSADAGAADLNQMIENSAKDPHELLNYLIVNFPKFKGVLKAINLARVIQKGFINTVVLLIRNGVTVIEKNLLVEAIKKGSQFFIPFCEAAAEQLKDARFTLAMFFQMIEHCNNDPASIECFLKYCPFDLAQKYQEMRPLDLAAQLGFDRVVLHLLTVGALVNNYEQTSAFPGSSHFWHSSALHYASANFQLTVVKILLRHGAGYAYSANNSQIIFDFNVLNFIDWNLTAFKVKNKKEQKDAKTAELQQRRQLNYLSGFLKIRDNQSDDQLQMILTKLPQEDLDDLYRQFRGCVQEISLRSMLDKIGRPSKYPLIFSASLGETSPAMWSEGSGNIRLDLNKLNDENSTEQLLSFLRQVNRSIPNINVFRTFAWNGWLPGVKILLQHGLLSSRDVCGASNDARTIYYLNAAQFLNTANYSEAAKAVLLLNDEDRLDLYTLFHKTVYRAFLDKHLPATSAKWVKRYDIPPPVYQPPLAAVAAAEQKLELPLLATPSAPDLLPLKVDVAQDSSVKQSDQEQSSAPAPAATPALNIAKEGEVSAAPASAAEENVAVVGDGLTPPAEGPVGGLALEVEGASDANAASTTEVNVDPALATPNVAQSSQAVHPLVRAEYKTPDVSVHTPSSSRSVTPTSVAEQGVLQAAIGDAVSAPVVAKNQQAPPDQSEQVIGPHHPNPLPRRTEGEGIEPCLPADANNTPSYRASPRQNLVLLSEVSTCRLFSVAKKSIQQMMDDAEHNILQVQELIQMGDLDEANLLAVRAHAEAGRIPDPIYQFNYRKAFVHLLSGIRLAEMMANKALVVHHK